MALRVLSRPPHLAPLTRGHPIMHPGRLVAADAAVPERERNGARRHGNLATGHVTPETDNISLLMNIQLLKISST